MISSCLEISPLLLRQDEPCNPSLLTKRPHIAHSVILSRDGQKSFRNCSKTIEVFSEQPSWSIYLFDLLAYRIQVNLTGPEESLIDSTIFGSEVLLVTGQVMDGFSHLCSSQIWQSYLRPTAIIAVFLSNHKHN